MPWLTTTAPPVLVGPPFALAFLWLGLAIGRRLLRFLGAAGGHTSERALAMLVLGLGVLEFVPFSLGLAGVLSVTSVRVALRVVAALALPDLAAVARGAGRQARLFWRRPTGWELACVLVVAPCVVAAGLIALTPSFDADGLSYHLAVPKRWLERGSLGYLPTYVYSNTPMGVEMLFTSALAWGGDVAAKVLHFTLGLAGAVGVYATGKHWRGRAVGAAATILYLAGPAAVAQLLGWAYLEGAIGLAIVAGTAAWLAWQRTRDAGWLRVACLLAGISVTFKLTSVLFAAGLVAFTLIVSTFDARDKNARFGVDRTLLGAAALLAAPVLPWLVRSAWATRNPLYPMFASVIPTRDYSARTAALYEAHNRYFVWGSTATWGVHQRQLILLAFAVVLCAVAGVVAWRLRGRTERACTAVVLGIVLLQLAMVGPYIRYWVPLGSVLALPFLGLLQPLLTGFWRPALLLGVAAGASLKNARASFADVGNDVTGVMRTAFGAEPAQTFLTQKLPLFPLFEHVNRDTAASSVVLLSNYCGGSFHVDRETLCSEFLQDSVRLTDWNEFSEDVAALHVTHVVAPRSFIEPGEPAGPPRTPTDVVHRAQARLIGQLLRERGRLLEAASDQGLYVLGPPPPR